MIKELDDEEKLNVSENENYEKNKENNKFDEIQIKDSKYYKNKIKILFSKPKTWVFISFFSAYFFYFLSLEKCKQGVDQCPREIHWIKTKIAEIIISCIIIVVLIELMIVYKMISKLNLIHIIIIYILFYMFSHGLDFHDHGFFNIIGFLIVFVIVIIISIPINGLIYFMRKENKIFALIYTIIFIIFISIFSIIYENYTSDCEDWPKGLNNTYMDNNNSTKYGCQIVFPRKCPYKVFSKFQDYTKLKGKDCKNFNFEGKQNLLKMSKSPYINDKINRVGYPLTNKDPICFIDFIDSNNLIEDYFLKNIVDMDNEKILNQFFDKKMPEIEVDFTNNTQGKLIINLNYNKTLSEERLSMEKNINPYSDNIIILYIDSVSRNNALRKLQKTLKFFEQFMPYKGGFHEKYPTENFHSFQFFKYHSFIYHTPYNYPLIFYGQSRSKDMVSITKYFKENGYITSYCGDYCDKDNIRTLHNMTLEEAYDYQFILCDPNREHLNINTIKCLYGKQMVEHLYDYSDQFWRKYKNNRKFLSIVTNDGHEGTLEVLKYVDDIIFNFLNNLFNDNLLKGTSIFLLSDHGDGMPSLYYNFDFYTIEEHLPMLFVIINDRKNISYEEQFKNMYKNQQTFVTAYDIHNTISNLIFGDKYISIQNKTPKKNTPKTEHGSSLFDEIDPKTRLPKKYSKIGNMVDYVCR